MRNQQDSCSGEEQDATAEPFDEEPGSDVGQYLERKHYFCEDEGFGLFNPREGEKVCSLLVVRVTLLGMWPEQLT